MILWPWLVSTDDSQIGSRQQGCSSTVAVAAMPLSRSLRKECCLIERSPQPNLSKDDPASVAAHGASQPKEDVEKSGAKLPSPPLTTESEAGSLTQDQIRRVQSTRSGEASACSRRHRGDRRRSRLNALLRLSLPLAPDFGFRGPSLCLLRSDPRLAAAINLVK